MAQANMRKVVLNYKLRFFSDECRSAPMLKDVQEVARLLTLAIVGAEYDKKMRPEQWELDSVLQVLVKIIDNGGMVPLEDCWDICDSMDLAVQVTGELSVHAVNHANREMNKL